MWAGKVGVSGHDSTFVLYISLYSLFLFVRYGKSTVIIKSCQKCIESVLWVFISLSKRYEYEYRIRYSSSQVTYLPTYLPTLHRTYSTEISTVSTEYSIYLLFALLDSML